MKKLIHIDLIKLYEFLYTICLGTGFMVSVHCYFSFPFSQDLLLCLVIGFSFLLYCIKNNGTRIWLFACSAVLSAVFALYQLKSGKSMEQYYMALCLAALCLTASILCYLSQQHFWLKAPLILLQFACLIFYSIRGITLPKWTVCIILMCFLLFLTETVGRLSGKKSFQNTLCMFPVFFLVMLLFLKLPVKNTPMRWETFKKFGSFVSEKATALLVDAEYLFSGGDTSYSLSFSGYGADGKLSGNVISSSKPQLTIQGIRTNSPLYLSGSIYNSYTGQGWEADKGKKPYKGKEYLFQYDELMSALSQSIYSEEEAKELYHLRPYKLKFDGIKTKSLFFSPVTRKLTIPENTKFTETKGDSPMLVKAKGVGFEYEMSFIELDYGNEKLQNLLRQQAFLEAPGTKGEFKKRRDYIYKNYTKLPDTVPDRVYKLSDEITAGKATDYDRLKAIESYVNAYTYSTEPDTCPSDRDFTDYFLFDGKTGYCTYFATAMAVLGRCQGIPTRYVEGFVTADTLYKDNQPIELYGRNAHAWTEAYIDHVGWVPFEATPGYNKAANRLWNQPQKSGTAGKLPTSPAEQSVSVSTEEPATEIEQADIKGDSPKFFLPLLKLLSLVTLLSVLFLAFLAVRRVYRRKQYLSCSEYEKLVYYMKKALFFGKLHGCLLEDGETLAAYGQRLDGCLDTPLFTFAQLCRLYEGIRFGENPVLAEDILQLEAYTKHLEKQYLTACGRMQKLIYYIR